MGSTKDKKVTKAGIGSLILEELSNIDISHAVPSQSGFFLFAFTGSKQGSLKMVSKFPTSEIIGFCVLRENILGDRPDDLVDVLPGFKLRWPPTLAKQREGVQIIVPETPRVHSTLKGI